MANSCEIGDLDNKAKTTETIKTESTVSTGDKTP